MRGTTLYRTIRPCRVSHYPCARRRVEHHFDVSRLSKETFILALSALGRSQAYIYILYLDTGPLAPRRSRPSRVHPAHVFPHCIIEAKECRQALPPPVFPSEGPLRQSYYVRALSYLRQSLVERHQARQYNRYAPRRRVSGSESVLSSIAKR